MTDKTATPALTKVFGLANKVAATAKKADLYLESKKQPPETLSEELHAGEFELDALMKGLLECETDLKTSLMGSIGSKDLNKDGAAEVEWSYKKAVSLLSSGDDFSRVFFIPFVFFKDGFGRASGILELNPRRKRALEDFLSEFVNSRFLPDDAEKMRVMIGETILDWVVGADEEKHIPKLHRSILDNSEFDLSAHFHGHRKLGGRAGKKAGEEAGWSIGAVPFCLLNNDEDTLLAVSFAGSEDEFEEEFEEIFDSGSDLDYHTPVDPYSMADESVKILWEYQLLFAIDEMLDAKTDDQGCLIETTFLWEDNGGMKRVAMDFQIGAADGMSVLYHKRLVRQSLSGEGPDDVAGLVTGLEILRRQDVKTVFGHDLDDSFDETPPVVDGES